jgi:hypothetical protein
VTKQPRPPPWTEAETAELIRLHALMYSAREMAELLKRPSRSAILGKLHRLGLSLAVSPAHAACRTSWTKEQVAELRKLKRAGRTVAEIAERLGKGSPAIRSKIRAIGEGSARRAHAAALSHARRVDRLACERRKAPSPPRYAPGAPVPFLEAGRGHCRYPLWSGRPPLAERMVCGAAAEPGWSYCRRHHAACHHRRPGL